MKRFLRGSESALIRREIIPLRVEVLQIVVGRRRLAAWVQLCNMEVRGAEYDISEGRFLLKGLMVEYHTW